MLVCSVHLSVEWYVVICEESAAVRAFLIGCAVWWGWVATAVWECSDFVVVSQARASAWARLVPMAVRATREGAGDEGTTAEAGEDEGTTEPTLDAPPTAKAAGGGGARREGHASGTGIEGDNG